MKVIYFTVPIIGGWYIMQAAIGYSDRNTAHFSRHSGRRLLPRKINCEPSERVDNVLIVE